MSFLYVILGVVVIAIAFKINTWLGVGILAAIAAFGIYQYLPMYYVTRGNQAFQRGDEQEAYKWYKKGYDTGRMNVKTKSSYAYLLMRLDKADEAEKILDPIIRVKGLDPKKKNVAKQQRCMVYYRQGRIKEAVDEAMELYNDGYRTSNLYGMLGYFKQLNGDDMDEVLKICEEAYEYDKDNRDILDNLALCYYKLGRYEDAEKISDELMANSDTFVEGCYHGAQIALALGKHDKAKELLSKLAECKRSAMTTITEEEIEKLRQEVEKA